MKLLANLLIILALLVVASPLFAATGKTPVIVIPGLLGSDLVNKRTNEVVWFKTRRSKDDDVRLPIAGNLLQNQDDLVTKDILRGVKLVRFLPEVEIYERLIQGLDNKGGYREASWTSPKKGDDKDTFYVFPYDWRRDNVENAQLLILQIENLKKRLKKPNLKFNVVAHSMGGLIARYAAMYGNAELSEQPSNPTWAGAKHLDKIFLLGTPNEGSVQALDALLNGVPLISSNINIPFVRDISRFDVFTMPSLFQLLPFAGTFVAYDDNLKRLDVDIYDPSVWEKYGWTVWNNDEYKKQFTQAEVDNIKSYFNATLARAARFHAALNSNKEAKIPVSFYLMGANCKDTQNAVILHQNTKLNRWETIFRATPLTNAAGEKISSAQTKAILLTTGDSTVPMRSLAVEDYTLAGNANVLPVVSIMYQCETHNRLATNPEIQDKLFALLGTVNVH